MARRVELDDSVKGLPAHAEGIDPLGDLRIFEQGRCVVGFYARVDDDRSSTSPVFPLHGCSHPVQVGGGIGACERGPKEIMERSRREGGVVRDYHERE